jgi:alpha-galactosidase
MPQAQGRETSGFVKEWGHEMSDAEPEYLVLHGQACTFVLETSSSTAPIWRYWGGKLPPGTVPAFTMAHSQTVPSFSLDQNVPLTLFPTFGIGWYGAPALLAHRGGQAFAHDFTRTQITWIRPHEALLVRLFDDVAAVQVDINLDLNSSNDTLTAQTTLTNLGEIALDVSWLAAICLPIPETARSVRYYTGQHNGEFDRRVDTLSQATWLRENRRGLTSHDCVPGAVVTTPTTDHHTGDAYGAQIAWSGNHAQRLDCNEDGSYTWQLGEWLAPGEVELKQGQALTSPEILATYSPHGLNGIAQNFHAAVRNVMRWPGGLMRPRPVHFNTWEGVYFDLDETALMAMADGAASLGVERFVLDDGWFHDRRHDRAGLGDWWVDETIFPNGLLPLARKVTNLGMEFGLWVEPEMVNPDSDMFRAHPDWALQLEGRPLLTARNQLVLDLSNRDVFTYLLGRLGALMNALPISYLKWDHNRYLTTAGSNSAPAYRKQVQAAYALFDAIRDSWPHVEIEACAGGGGRIDAGILKYTQRVWTSDCIDAVSRVSIQRGFLQFFPPEIMGSHIGTSPAHATGRRQSMPFRSSVALGGHLGIELDPRHLTDHARSDVASCVATYKALRHRLHAGRVWRDELADGMSWQAQGDVHDCVVSVFRVAPSRRRFPPKLKLPFVDQSVDYEIVVVSHQSQSDTSTAKLPVAWRKGGLTISGAWLAQAGITLPTMSGEEALILTVKAASESASDA